MSDEWILSTDKEKCPECEAKIAHYKKLLEERPINWLKIATLDYLIDFDGEELGVGGIIEVGC